MSLYVKPILNQENMSKVVFITNNSPEIRIKLSEEGFILCPCAAFKDAIWLDYDPNSPAPNYIHGEGYADEGDIGLNLSPLDRIHRRLELKGYYSEEKEFYPNAEEFLEHYKPKQIG